MSVFGHRGKIKVTKRSMQDEVDELQLTEDEVELLELYDSMPADARDALTRLAQFLNVSPQSEPQSKEEMKQLFELARSLQ